jgi:hypothetical protein
MEIMMAGVNFVPIHIWGRGGPTIGRTYHTPRHAVRQAIRLLVKRGYFTRQDGVITATGKTYFRPMVSLLDRVRHVVVTHAKPLSYPDILTAIPGCNITTVRKYISDWVHDGAVVMDTTADGKRCIVSADKKGVYKKRHAK